jgi:predicted ATP-dependent endonuclease of OLD family
LSVDLDVTSKGSWESGIVCKLDGIPFDFVGKGEQNCIKVQLALDAASNCQVLLIEEPENHLSFTKLNQLITQINERSSSKQLFINTHSNFILNKLDIGNVLLLRNNKSISLDQLSSTTRDYFLKLPGYDTLRLILSNKKTILVEGPSDELVVQKAYKQIHGHLPLEDGIDVITVRGLAFKRFLEISEMLDIETHVITDNDGDFNAVKNKYADFDKNPNIHIHCDSDEKFTTLESQLVHVNELALMNKILEKEYETTEKLLTHMMSPNYKTECALKIFNSNTEFVIPTYIKNALYK